MANWVKGQSFRKNRNPNILEGIPAIADFIGKSRMTALNWIKKHGLPVTKTPEGRWYTHKGLILMWIVMGHEALKARGWSALEPETIATIKKELFTAEEDDASK